LVTLFNAGYRRLLAQGEHLGSTLCATPTSVFLEADFGSAGATLGRIRGGVEGERVDPLRTSVIEGGVELRHGRLELLGFGALSLMTC
jgi:hypothetical protein